LHPRLSLTPFHIPLDFAQYRVADGRPAGVSDHYRRVVGWRVGLSDAAALNFGAMELFILGLLAVALVRACLTGGAGVGSIYAVFRYVLMFVAGLDCVPHLVQQLSRLRDIGRRMKVGNEADPPCA
jgi:hypothetical protein